MFFITYLNNYPQQANMCRRCLERSIGELERRIPGLEFICGHYTMDWKMMMEYNLKFQTYSFVNRCFKLFYSVIGVGMCLERCVTTMIRAARLREMKKKEYDGISLEEWLRLFRVAVQEHVRQSLTDVWNDYRQKCAPNYIEILKHEDMAERINFVFKIAGPDFEESTKIEFVPGHMLRAFAPTSVFDSNYEKTEKTSS